MRTVQDAEAEAAALVEQLRRDGNPQQRTVYILDGCDCPEQGGADVPFHVHAFTWEQYRHWRALQPSAKPIHSYPAGPFG